MTTPTNLGGGLRSSLMINETTWNTGKVFPVAGSVRFFQRAAGGTTYTLTVSGTYKGTTPSSVQVQIVDAVTLSTIVVAAATLDAAPANNAFTGTVVVPQGNLDGSHQYRVQVWDSAVPAIVITSYSIIVVGIKIAFGDQSNGLKKFGAFNRTPLTASAGTYAERGSLYTAAYPIASLRGTDDATANNGNDGFGGDGHVMAANQMVAVTRIPVCFKQYSIGSTVVAQWKTLANGGTHTSWDNTVTCTTRTAADADFEMVYGIVPGESDSVVATAKATYKAAVTLIGSQWLTLCGRAHVPLVVEIIGRDQSATAANTDAIRQAQLEVVDADVTGDYSLSIRTDQYSSVQDPHFNTIQYQLLGTRVAAECLFRLGFTSFGMKGPKLTSITASAATQTITLTCTHDGGSSFKDSNGNTAGTGLTPFRAFNGVTQKTINSTAFASGTTITITLAAASFIAGDTINLDYMYGLPTVRDYDTSTGNCVYDNLTVPGSTLGRPLQPSRGQLTCTAGA